MYVNTFICQVFVKCVLCHIVYRLVLKISVHAVSTLDKEIKRNPKVQDPGIMRVWVLRELKISIFPFSNLCDSNCKPFS